MPTQAVREEDGKVTIVEGTYCSSQECWEHGCCFPDCAQLGDQYPSEEAARKDHPDIQIV